MDQPYRSMSPSPSRWNISSFRNQSNSPPPSQHRADYSSIDLVPSQKPARAYPTTGRQPLRRYYLRAIANTLGPVAIVGVYLFIVFEYLQREEQNGVIPNRPLSANAIFFTWIILSIFLLEWARSALAGFEAAALMKPKLAPATAAQLMWHSDRDWGQLGGWWKASIYLVKFTRARIAHRGYAGVGSQPEWKGPVGLWWYLSASSFLFYAAVPLSGLSMNPADSLELGNHPVAIIGANETTFGARANSEVAAAAVNGWRLGGETTPESPTVFYAPEDVGNASSLYYSEAIEAIYQSDLSDNPPTARNVTFFSGPRVTERVHGTAWGLLTTIGCTPVNIYTGLELLSITSYSNWTVPVAPGLDSATFNSSTSYQTYGLSPAIYFQDNGFGLNFTYLVASDHDILGVGNPDYTDPSTLPIEGSFEFALWQSTLPSYPPDAGFQNLTSDPLSETSQNQTGFAVRCAITTDVGTASLSPSTHTFSTFTRQPANFTPALTATSEASVPIFEYAGGYALQTLIFSALSGVVPGYMGPPTCLPKTSPGGGVDSTCNAAYGANLATANRPVQQVADTGAVVLRQPTLTPQRLCLALYRLVGEAAAATMAVGDSGTWTSPELLGLRPASDLQGGFVPWWVVLGVLGAWAVLTVAPQVWMLGGRRWAATLGGEDMLRFGVQLGREGWDGFEGVDGDGGGAVRVPGLIGDRRPDEPVGEVGLSRYRARTKGDREYIQYTL